MGGGGQGGCEEDLKFLWKLKKNWGGGGRVRGGGGSGWM